MATLSDSPATLTVTQHLNAPTPISETLPKNDCKVMQEWFPLANVQIDPISCCDSISSNAFYNCTNGRVTFLYVINILSLELLL
jgi:hypothetical protein